MPYTEMFEAKMLPYTKMFRAKSKKKHQRGFVLTGALGVALGKLMLNWWRLSVIFAPMQHKIPILAVGVGERVQRVDAAFDVRDLHMLVARTG